MTQLKNDPSKIQDDQLAEFTDQVLAGKITQTASNADEELLALEETVLRLKTAFPPSQLNKSTINQMQTRLNARMKKEREAERQPFWQKWFSGSNARPQFAMALAAVAMVALLVVFLPNEAPGSSTTATAQASPQNYIAVIALLAVVLILWNMRRK